MDSLRTVLQIAWGIYTTRTWSVHTVGSNSVTKGPHVDDAMHSSNDVMRSRNDVLCSRVPDTSLTF